MKQAGLSDNWSDAADSGAGTSNARPDAEALAVAGNDTQHVSAIVDADEVRFPDADGNVELLVTQVNYSVERAGHEEYPVVHIFGRTTNDVAHHVRVLGFEPYFYAPTETLDDELLDNDAITRTESGYESIRGEELTKICTRTPRDVGQIRDDFDHYEADILFPNRLLIDKDIKSGIRVPARRLTDNPQTIQIPHNEIEPVDVEANLRVNTFDIEVDDRSGFPEDGEEPIVCLTSHDSERDEYITWLYEAPDAAEDAHPPDSLDRDDPIRPGTTADVRTFNHEDAMLDAFVSYIEQTDPDILTGWNCLPSDTRIQMADGTETEIHAIEIGDKVIGTTDQRSVTTEVTNKWESETEIYEFSLADGTSLRSSGDHRIMISDADVVGWKNGSDVDPGEYVLKPRQLPVDDPVIPTVNELLSSESIRVIDNSNDDTLNTAGEHINTLSSNLRRSRARPNLPSITDGGYQKQPPKNDDTKLFDLDHTVTERELYAIGRTLHTQRPTENKPITSPAQTTSIDRPASNSYSPTDTQYRFDSTLSDIISALRDLHRCKTETETETETDVDGYTHTLDLSAIYRMPQSHIAHFLAGALDSDGADEIASSHLTVATESSTIAEWYARLYRRLGIYAQQQADTVQIANNACDLQRLSDVILPHLRCSDTINRVESHIGAICDNSSEHSQTTPLELATNNSTRQCSDNEKQKESNTNTISSDNSDHDHNWDAYVFVEIEEITQTGTETTYDIATTTRSFVADDCLVHNCDDFDVPYVLDRMEVINPQSEYTLTPERFSRIDEVWRSGWGGPNIKGRVVFDLLYAYKRTQFTELESYRLDAVGELELDVGKERYPGDIGDLWEQDPQQLLEYNLRDVELCVEIDRKQDIIAFWDEVRSFVGCKLEDATTPGDTVDIYILHEAHDRFALPSKGRTDTEDYEGGAVFDPVTGVKEMVGVLDLKSLYPMAMTTINASPETKVDPQSYDGDTFRAPNGTHFRQSPDGIIREMIDDLLAEREEKKSLRDQYDPGESVYEQYDRQQTAVKVIMNCFTPDTDVLTPNGVENIRDLTVGDNVYSLNPDTMQMEIKPVTETHAYPNYRGSLVDIQTDEIDFSITPNHRMLVRTTAANADSEVEYEFIEAGNLDSTSRYELPHEWSVDHADSLGEYIDVISLLNERADTYHTLSDGGTTTLPSVDHNRDGVMRRVDSETFLSVIGWYVATGRLSRTENGATGVQLQLPQTDTETQTQLTALLDELGIDWQGSDETVQFVSHVWAELLDTICGREDANKRVPELIFDASADQKRAFFDAMIDGSGVRETDSYQYDTSNKALRDDILRLCVHIGLSTRYYRVNDESWRIECTEATTPNFTMTNSGQRKTAEEGVYCVTVADNHTLLAGRNGTFQWTGNSLYGVLGWDRFRLYDKEMGAAVTATGRDAIEHTANAASELDKTVIYGDSVTGDRPVVVRDPRGYLRIIPIGTLFEQATVPEQNARLTADGAPTGSSGLPKERRHLSQWEALSLTDAGETEWQPIKQIIRHQTEKEVITLQHEHGESTTTRDHSYITADNGEYVETPPEDVDEPLPIPEIAPIKTIETIDIYQTLTTAAHTHTGSDIETSERLPSTDHIHATDEYVWIDTTPEGQNKHDSIPAIPRYIDLTSDTGHALIRFLGVYLSDWSESTVTISEQEQQAQQLDITGPHESVLRTCTADADQLFINVTPTVTANAENNANAVDGEYSCHIPTTLATTLVSALAGHPACVKQVPSVIYHLPDAEQSRFIQCLIGAEYKLTSGTSLNDSQNINDPISSTGEFTANRELAAGVSMLLTQREQSYSIVQQDAEDTYTIRINDTESSSSECHPTLTETAHSGYVYDLSVEANQNFVDGLGGLVLHNTDSVMLELGDDMNKQEAIERSFEVEEYINDSYDEFAREELDAARHRFEIEFEKLYRRFFQAGKKKRYAGHIIWKEGKDVDDIDITGFEYKRSDIAPITKEVQRRVIEMIVYGEGTDSISEYLSDIINDFESGNIPLEDIGIPGGIGKRLESYDTATAQVRGAKYANEFLGTNFGRGSKPKRVYLRKVHPSWFRQMETEAGFDPQRHGLYREFKRDPDVICFEYEDQIPDAFAVDWDLMLEKTLKGPIERIIEALGMSWNEVKSGQEQTGLGNFI